MCIESEENFDSMGHNELDKNWKSIVGLMLNMDVVVQGLYCHSTGSWTENVWEQCCHHAGKNYWRDKH